MEQVVVGNPLIVSPDTLVTDAIALMSNARATSALQSTTSGSNSLLADARASCVLVVKETQVIGIFTEQDVVRLSAHEHKIAGVAIADVMTRSVITLRQAEFTDIFVARNLFQRYSIRHIPILDDGGLVVGLVTHESLCQLLRPIDPLQLHLVLMDRLDEKVFRREAEKAERQTNEDALHQSEGQYTSLAEAVFQELEAKVEHRTAALREREEMFRQLAENIEDVFWIRDKNDNLLYISPSYERIWGRSIEQLYENSTAWLEAIHPDDRDRVAAADAAQFSIDYDEEYQVIHPNNEVRWVRDRSFHILNDQKEVYRIVGIVEDITRRKQAEEMLKGQLAAIEAAIDGIALLDGDTYTYLNTAHLELFGYKKPEELIGKTWRELYSPEEICRFEQDIFPILMQQRFWQGEATATRKDASTFAEGLSLTITENGKLICVCRDISEQKEAEKQLRQMNEKLALVNAELHRATRLKDEFLANMSHELRTPLNAILGMSEGLQEEVFGQLNVSQRQAIKAIERSGKHLLELINDILDLSKIDSEKLELQTAPVSVSYLCESSLTFIRQQAIKKNIKLIVDIPPELPKIVVDERRIRQVLINLLNNAVKFTTSDGSIRLVVELEQHQDREYLCLSVVDTGIGIAQENINRLFQPFVQIDSSLNREHTGTGLGLAIVRRLVELHQGTVKVTSEVGRGSCFTVSLPYANEFIPSTTPIPQLMNKNVLLNDNSQVLIIEDSIAAAEQVARYFSELNMHTAIHFRGEGAINEALYRQPALIVLDLLLPNLSGWEVLKQLKAHPQTKNIPVLVISVVDERSQALSLGATEYLVKPVTREQIRKTLEQLRRSEQPAKTALMTIQSAIANEKNFSPLILLAEDNEANIVTISSYLKARGYHLILAKTGQEAVALTKAQYPDLIIMDIQMPEMNGLEAMRQIRSHEEFLHTPILALTALAMPGDRENCTAAGANDYLSKPVKLKRLVEKIQHLLNNKSP
ncbi:MAG: response regulator [Scytonema sp. PMC 1069.18]|nr:response regulator [Scytonema sp. PMC 1069.18]